ncbi:restriction endonuclease subunit S [Aeromonas caviae]|uniref:restriction endonuclease subunit S n=1 Tax=Aeromonas hydrophila TaxID=644 RepID=UPI001EEE6803|nr:restriction endonuclease subunit S [Aeromonas hydrophila]
MSSDWEPTTLGSVCDRQGGSIQTGPFGSQLHASDYVEQGIPVVMPANIGSDGGISEDGIARITQFDADRLQQHKLQVGDVVFSRRGDVTRNALIEAHQAGWLCGTGCLKVRLGSQTQASAKFISYCLRLPETKDWLVRHAVGATMPNLNTSILSAVPILLPELTVQQSIANILGCLDERIDLLRETNATLEAIAQALFKSWFVDFDPVHACARGEQPAGLAPEVAALFPDSFEESPLGLVPRGWSLSQLSEAYEINPTRKLKKGEMAPYLDMASVATSGHTVAGVADREMGSGTKFINGDTLLARITPCLENGKTAFVDFLSQEQTGWGSTEFVVLRPKAPLPAYHGYLLARHTAFREHAIQSMSGTSGRQRVQNDVLSRYLVTVPSEKVAMAFNDVISPLQQKITENHRQAQTLANLRDTLLPRLISGQLRLPDAEQQLKDLAV